MSDIHITINTFIVTAAPQIEEAKNIRIESFWKFLKAFPEVFRTPQGPYTRFINPKRLSCCSSILRQFYLFFFEISEKAILKESYHVQADCKGKIGREKTDQGRHI
jgi:hypothetical protein